MYQLQKLQILFWALLCTTCTWSQISPPGLGNANTAFWSALGVRQNLDSIGKKQILTYVGFGSKSDIDHYNPFQKQALYVLNSEITVKLPKNQTYSYAISYRRQAEYNPDSPYEKEGIEQEFRVYGRYAYTLPFNRWKWKNTFRQEFRKFFDTDFKEVSQNLQLRTRLKSQISYQIAKKNKQSIAFSAEALFATSLLNGEDRRWTTFAYKEARFGLFYSTNIPNTPLSMDIGYANNQIRNNKDKPWGVHYLSLDLVWNI